MKTKFLLLLIAAVILNISNAAAATSYTWTGSSNTNWNNNGNWSPSTGYPVAGDNVTIPNTGNKPTVNVTSACASITISATTTITLSAALTVSAGITVNNTSTLTFAGTGTASIAGTTSLTYNTSLVIGTNSNITFPASSVISMAGNNLNTITNNGSLTLTGNTLTFGYLSVFANNGTINATSSTMNFAGNNNTLTNNGSVTVTSCTFNINSQYSGITNPSGKTFTGTSCTFNLSANYTVLSNSGSFLLTNCPINLSGQGSTITNTGSGATFSQSGGAITIGTANSANITNSSGANFIGSGGASILISSYTGFINNSANFYAGTSNSACPITLTAQGANITNSGTFYVGSTSGITLSTGINQYVTNTGSFAFQSDQYGSAYVGPITQQSPSNETGVFNGTYNVERYITGGSAFYRSYRIFSSPVYAATDAYSNKIYSINYVQSSALVTGSTGTGGGFDKTGNPSIYLFREDLPISNSTFISGNFWGISKINNSPVYNYNVSGNGTTYNIPVGNGFLFWFRGDRTSNLANKYTPGTSAESVTMTATGTLNQGSFTVHTWFNPSSATLSNTTGIANAGVRGYIMVGNPYASPIDWETFQQSTTTLGIYGTSLVHNYIYLLNPKTHNYGAYAKGNAGVGTNNATNIIESGQGFIIADSCSCSKLIFNESAKTTSQATGLNLFMGKPAEITNMQYLRLQLAEDTVNTDDLLVRFSANVSSTFKPTIDVPYKTGFGDVSLASMSSDHVPLAINVQPFPKTGETIGLTITASTDGIYSLNMQDLVSIPRLYDIWLMDAYKKDSLDMRQNKTYSFNVLKSDSSTFGSKRFSLVIRQNPAYAYQLLDFTAAKTSGINIGAMQVQVVWKTANEQNYTNFTVERSTDNGKTFDVLGSVQASDLGTYSLLDKDPVVGQNLYRLKQEDINNSISYSNIVPVMYSNIGDSLVKNNINVYPNPAKSNITLNIASDTTIPATYNIQITNSSGLLIRQATSAEPNWQTSVNDLLPGTYIVKVFNSKDNSGIGNTKFIKL